MLARLTWFIVFLFRATAISFLFFLWTLPLFFSHHSISARRLALWRSERICGGFRCARAFFMSLSFSITALFPAFSSAVSVCLMGWLG